jgi:hypothetical protein
MAISPGQELIDLAVGMAVDDPGEDVTEICEAINLVQLAGLCRPPNCAERIPYGASLSRWHRRSRDRAHGGRIPFGIDWLFVTGMSSYICSDQRAGA